MPMKEDIKHFVISQKLIQGGREGVSLNIFTFCRYMYISRLGGGWGIFFQYKKSI